MRFFDKNGGGKYLVREFYFITTGTRPKMAMTGGGTGARKKIIKVEGQSRFPVNVILILALTSVPPCPHQFFSLQFGNIIRDHINFSRGMRFDDINRCNPSNALIKITFNPNGFLSQFSEIFIISAFKQMCIKPNPPKKQEKC